jgi:hypothetical protein
MTVARSCACARAVPSPMEDEILWAREWRAETTVDDATAGRRRSRCVIWKCIEVDGRWSSSGAMQLFWSALERPPVSLQGSHRGQSWTRAAWGLCTNGRRQREDHREATDEDGTHSPCSLFVQICIRPSTDSVATREQTSRPERRLSASFPRDLIFLPFPLLTPPPPHAPHLRQGQTQGARTDPR